MARAAVTWNYLSGESVTCEVETTLEHPDILDECVTRAFKLYTMIDSVTDHDNAEPDAGDTEAT